MSHSTRWARRAAIGVLVLLIAGGSAVAYVHLQAEYHYRAACRELDHYHYGAARRHVDACLSVNPRSARFNFLAARCYRRAGDLDAAERYLQLCAGGIPSEQIVLERMMIRAQMGDVEAVMPNLRERIQSNDPNSLLYLEALARGYISLYRFRDVDLVLHMWRERYPDDSLGLFFLAWLREQLGPREEAVHLYQTVLERDPENDEVRLRLANLLLERSQPRDALPHLEELTRRLPDNLMVQVRLARSYHDLGRLDAARVVLDNVIDGHPDYAPGLTARGRLALQEDQQGAAETWLRKATQLDKSDYQGLFLLHQALEWQGKKDEAEKIDQRMRVIDADTRRLHDIVTKGMGQSPEDPELHVQAGEILLRAGEAKEGLKWLFQALKFDGRYWRAHKVLAEHFEAAGDAKRAAFHRKQAGLDASAANSTRR